MLMVGSAAGVVVGEVAAAAEKEKSESREKRSQKLGARRKGAAIRMFNLIMVVNTTIDIMVQVNNVKVHLLNS